MKLLIHNIKYRLQILLHKFGWHISRYTPLKAEEDVFEIKRALLKDGSTNTILDIGAWIGKTSLKYGETFPNSKIHAFEPFPQSFQKLKETTHSLRNRLVLNELAVSNEVGLATFNSNKIETTNSLLSSTSTDSEHDFFRDTVATIEVATTTLDAYCDEAMVDRINILKMDTQGGELKVLQGAERLLSERRIDLIYCEVSFVAMYKDSPLFHDICAFLEKRDYVLHGLYGIVKNEFGQIAWGDALFYSPDVYNSIKSRKQ